MLNCTNSTKESMRIFSNLPELPIHAGESGRVTADYNEKHEHLHY